MKTGAAETFLFDQQNTLAGASSQNGGILASRSGSNNYQLILITHTLSLSEISAVDQQVHTAGPAAEIEKPSLIPGA
jgi:hypothetical protein